jgi:tetratricopeptide (TPR) repeat protein
MWDTLYIEQQRWESALRHPTKAQEMSQSVELSDSDALVLAIDVAETYLSLSTIPQHELDRQLKASESALARFADIQTHHQRLGYRRDITLAQIYARKGRATEAMAQYAKVSQQLDDLNHGEVTQDSAELYKEIVEAANDPQTAIRMYKRAHSAYRHLRMHGTAKLLEMKIDPQLITDSDDEPPRPRHRKDRESVSLGDEESLNE